MHVIFPVVHISFLLISMETKQSLLTAVQKISWQVLDFIRRLLHFNRRRNDLSVRYPIKDFISICSPKIPEQSFYKKNQRMNATVFYLHLYLISHQTFSFSHFKLDFWANYKKIECLNSFIFKAFNVHII